MSGRGPIPELAETDACGEIARIYAEIRRLWAVPYVSSLQRHLATRPGWLEWSWAAGGAAFASGAAQSAAWGAVRAPRAVVLPVFTSPELRELGVDAEGERAISNVCESFTRVSPVNLAFSGVLRALLDGAPTGGRGFDGPLELPVALDPLPAMVVPDALPAPERAVLATLTTRVAGEPFLPGLYRMLARWPAFLDRIAPGVAELFENEGIGAECAALAARIDARVPELLHGLPRECAVPMPAEPEHAAVLETIATYRRTSPQMVLFGALIRDTLPSSRPAAEAT